MNIFHVDGRLSRFQIFPTKISLKRNFSLVLYKTNFGLLKFKSLFIKTKTQFINFIFFEFFSIPSINTTLKWHYINMFGKIDSVLII
jgi:hypothetical protein